MPRKFKLCRKKNEERKKYRSKSLVISIPLSLVSVKGQERNLPTGRSIPLSLVSVKGQERNLLLPPTGINLTVSLPLSFFINLPLNSLSALHSRLKMMPELLTGWVDATICPSQIQICRLHQIGISPCVQLTITIGEDLTWQVHYRLTRLEAGTGIFQSISSVVASIGNLCDLISVINASKFCIGNPDEKFDSLLSSHESGIFLNHSGMFLLCLQIKKFIIIIVMLNVLQVHVLLQCRSLRVTILQPSDVRIVLY